MLGNGGVSRCLGLEGVDRDVVFAPMFAALHSPRLSMQEQAFLWHFIITGQWTQLRKYPAARTLPQQWSTVRARRKRSKTRTCALLGGDWWLTHTRFARLNNASFRHPRCRWGKAFGIFMFLRIARAPAQYVTDSSFVERGVNQRGREATEAIASAWADLWRDVWRDRCLEEGVGRRPSCAQGQGAHFRLC